MFVQKNAQIRFRHEHIKENELKLIYDYCNLLLMQKIQLVENQAGYPLKDDLMTIQFCDNCQSSILSRTIKKYVCSCGYNTKNIELSEKHIKDFSHNDPIQQIINPICLICKMGYCS